MKELQDIKFPPIGKGLKYLVTCDDQPIAGFADQDEAKACRDMYAKNVRSAAKPSANSLRRWEVVDTKR